MAEALNGRKRQDPTGNSFFLADIYANAGLYLTGIPNISGSKVLYLDPTTGRVSYADASGSTAVSASYALTASYLEGTIASASFATSASYALSSSFAQTAGSASYALSGSFAQSASVAVSSSFASTASFVQIAQTASYVLNAVSASFATSASYALSASFATSASRAVSSSFASNAQTSNTASFVQTAQTASYVLNAVSASFATSASQAISASFANNSISASFAISSSRTVSASFATTASYVEIVQSASFAPNIYNSDGALPNSTRTVSFSGSTVLRFDLSSSGASSRVLFSTNAVTSGVRFTGSGYVWLDTANVAMGGIANLAQDTILGRDSVGNITYFNTSSIKLVQSASYAVTASFFSGSIANAIIADSASKILIAWDDQPLPGDLYYLPYAQPISGTYEGLLNDRSLRYDSGIRTLYATNFSGAFSGSLFGTAATASYAPNIYNSDGALSSSRLVDLNGQDLTFNADGGDFIIISNPNNTVSIELLTTGSAPNLIFQTPGDGKLFTSPTSSFTASFAVSASRAISASYAATASVFSGTLNRLTTGSVTASVNVTGDIFLVQSGSFTPFSISNTGATVISSSAQSIFLVKNSNNTALFEVSQSGVVTFSTQSNVLNNPAPVGAIYFTSASMYIGLE
jgi:hypothetical protein